MLLMLARTVFLWAPTCRDCCLIAINGQSSQMLTVLMTVMINVVVVAGWGGVAKS